jgi:hypothetical protein
MMMSGQTFKNKARNRCGFTIIEVMVASVMAVIITFGLAVVLSDAHRGWNTMYNRAYSDVVTGSHIAARTFDGIVRKSSIELSQFTADEVTACYYADSNSVVIDRYSRFYISDSNVLCVEYGQYNGQVKPPEYTPEGDPVTICGNVSFCSFMKNGRSMQMVLTLDNGKEELTTVTSAVMHN